MASSVKRVSKPVFKTTRPYTETEWPTLTTVQRTNIIDLLTNLLQPLGDHRKTHVQPSRGKKRKRDAKKDTAKEGPALPPPPVPEISNHILIGINSVTRHLEALAAQTAPPTMPAHIPPSTAKETAAEGQDDEDEGEDHSMTSEATGPKKSKTPTTPPQKLAFVLVPHNHPPSSLPHAHIPTLLHLSTMNTPPETATRLLAVPPGCESDIAAALHIPHVGALAVMEGAPGADALIAYVREQVPTTRCPWIDEAMKPEWKPVKMNAITA